MHEAIHITLTLEQLNAVHYALAKCILLDRRRSDFPVADDRRNEDLYATISDLSQQLPRVR